MSMTALEITG